jgi:hypothetical protein
MRTSASIVCAILLLFARPVSADEPMLDFTNAVVHVPYQLTGPEEKAVVMLIEEVEKRTQIRWRRFDQKKPPDDRPTIIVGRAGKVINDVGKPEGYSIWIQGNVAPPLVFVAGNDSRGVLFGIGRLLRMMEMGKQKVRLPTNINLKTEPHYSLRGHQLGYRPKTNSFDGWSLPIWEQYYRDLIVFGTNAIELIPPRSDDAADSPHFPLPPLEMMTGMSRLADQYGLDVWI